MRLGTFILGGLLLFSLSCGTAPEQNTGINQFKPSKIIGQVASPAGGAVAYESHGTGSTALVFVHGWSCDKSYWKHQVPVFEDDYQVVCLDLGGHGDSVQIRENWTLDGLVQDVLAVVNELKLDRVILIGHSMGGTVVVETAGRIPDRVIGIIGVDTLQNVEKQYSEEEFQAFVGPMEENFSETTMGFVTKGLFRPDADPELVKQVATDMAAGSPEVGVALMKNLFNHDLTAILKDMTIPIRLINADLYPTDEVANERHMQDFQLILMEGIGHFPQLEDPDRFNTVLRKVLSSWKHDASGDTEAP